jgi:hypothetical protein
LLVTTLIWQKIFHIDSNLDEGIDVVNNTDGGYTILCRWNIGEGNYYVLIKTDSNGIELWRKNLCHNYSYSFLASFEQTIDEGYVFTGAAYVDNNTLMDIVLLKTDRYGNTDINLSSESENISIFPNPNDGRFYIKAEVPINDITIYTIDGKKILAFKDISSHNNEIYIDESDLASGVYMINIKTIESTETYKIIIK